MLAIALGLAAACSAGSTGGADRPAVDGVVLASALTPFDACDDLLDYVRAAALDLVGPYGLAGHDLHWDEAVTEDGAGAVPAPAAREGVEFSGTNVQEVGVDEPDVVKTDGRRIFAVAAGRLHAIDVAGAQPVAAGSLRLPDGWGHELLLDGDRVLVSATTDDAGEALGGRPAPAPGRPHPAAPGGQYTVLVLYDVSDLERPTEVASLTVDGALLSSRMIDGTARLALRSGPVGLAFETPQGTGLLAEREATRRNEQVVRDSTVDNWVPHAVHVDAAGRRSEGPLMDCERVARPREFAGLDMVSVVTVDLGGDLAPAGTAAVVGGGETVYASAEHLYVSTTRWVDRGAPEPGDAVLPDATDATTDIHRFAITDPAGAVYRASGSVPGTLLSQWAMSEHDGVLRVASTAGSGGAMAPADGAGRSESLVTVLAERDGVLAQVGQVRGLGPDERIYAVRFLGDVGYVVTFRETDPLYTVDLSDPTDPRVLGELKILGYSAYLHPLADGLLLGVGQDATEEGRRLGIGLSLFDVSDLAAPRRLHLKTLSDGDSDVEYDHRAFLHWPPTGLTVVPYRTHRWDAASERERFDSGVLAFTVDADGFVEIGRVSHLDRVDDRRAGAGEPWDERAWQAGVRRALVVGERLYTLSELGLEASDLSSLADVGWVGFAAADGGE